MKKLILCREFFPRAYFLEIGEYIASVQLESGAIPWYEGGILDPWDHLEAAMGLSVAGFLGKARRALRWCAENQLPDGSLWPAYADSRPMDLTRTEAHHSAYLATGLWHYYLSSGDADFVWYMWPALSQGLDFACNLQTEQGEISWARLPGEQAYPDALLTGCSSIYKSLECGLNIASLLGYKRSDWAEARTSVGRAIRERPERFDRTWPSKQRYSMDWFYPVLSGVLAHGPAQRRLAQNWDLFVEPELGCRCVQEEPWITVAESCELVLSLLRVGRFSKATRVFSWLQQNRSAGGYWTGYQKEWDIYWPRERPTWTAAAVLLAADALYEVTPAAGVFTGVSRKEGALEQGLNTDAAK